MKQEYYDYYGFQTYKFTTIIMKFKTFFFLFVTKIKWNLTSTSNFFVRQLVVLNKNQLCFWKVTSKIQVNMFEYIYQNNPKQKSLITIKKPRNIKTFLNNIVALKRNT